MSVHPSPSPSRTSSYSNPPANGSSMAPLPPPFAPPPGPAPPPPSLREILGQFSEHGGGDRELLLSILTAKTAEEDRIASQMAYNSLLFSLSNSYPALQPSFGGPPSPAPSSASIPPADPAAQHASSLSLSTLVPFSLASPSPSNPPQPSSSSISYPHRSTLNGPSFDPSSTLPLPPPPTITTTSPPSLPSSSSHQLHPASISPHPNISTITLPQLPPFVRRGSSTGSANGTVRKLGLVDLLGGSVEASSSSSGGGSGREREESFVRGSPTTSTSGRVAGAEGAELRGLATGRKRNADDGEEEMEVDELDED